MVTKGICEKYTKMTVGVRLTLTKKRAIIQALPQECGGNSFAVRANITAKAERYIYTASRSCNALLGTVRLLQLRLSPKPDAVRKLHPHSGIKPDTGRLPGGHE